VGDPLIGSNARSSVPASASVGDTFVDYGLTFARRFVPELTPHRWAGLQRRARGLFFVGPVAANSFGPMLRFAYGAGFASRRVARALGPEPRLVPFPGRSYADSPS
jgi:hypothetical protein